MTSGEGKQASDAASGSWPSVSAMAARRKGKTVRLLGLIALASLSVARGSAADLQTMNTWLSLPATGHFELRIISPTILEVSHVNSKPPDPAPVDSWTFVGSDYQLHAPAPGQF